MHATVMMSQEARARLLELLAGFGKPQPLVIVNWHLPSKDLRRGTSGEVIWDPVPAHGDIAVGSWNDPVPSSSIRVIDGVPFYLGSLPPIRQLTLRVFLEHGKLKVQECAA
jgi:hypothetical protein